MQMRCGTPGFMAPEVFQKEGYTYKCDIFSLGIVFYTLLTGRRLFTAFTKEDMIKVNKKCELDQALKSLVRRVSVNCKGLLMWMLTKDPLVRPSAEEALKHEWFKTDAFILEELLVQN